MSEIKKSVLKEAITNYMEIKEAATVKAKNDLAEQFPDKFNDLLKEELQKNKKSVKESYKVLDETESSIKLDEIKNTEPVMGNTKKETKKVVTESANENQPFTKPAPKLQNEEFNITELDAGAVGTALETADNDDEIITMNEIEQELASMAKIEEDMKGLDNNTSPSIINKSIEDGKAFGKIVGLRKQLDEIIEGMGGVDNFDIKNMNKPEEETVTPIDEIVTDDDINNVLGAEETPVEEAHGLAYSSRRNMSGRHLPGTDHLSSGELDQAPDYVKESKTKISGLIKENMSLTKKLNDAKVYKDTVGGLLESYKTALGKYRSQLKEMAVFNTNLAYVNNLLVNEELALTQDDKVKIINEFASINSITASQNSYKKFLTEMKESKKTITESIEGKTSVSVGTSSKQVLDEVVERTAYSSDNSIKKMISRIDYMEKRDRK